MLLLSTLHSDQEIDLISGKPQIILDYNKTKGGVDTLDQMCAIFSSGRSTKRWPTAAFWCLVDIMGVNSFIIFKHYSSNRDIIPIQAKNRREFIYSLGEELTFPLMISRLDSNSLSRDLKLTITKLLNNKSIDFTNNINRSQSQNSSQSSNDSSKKRKLENSNQTRCYLCPRKANKKCTIRCDECEELICKGKHMVDYCTPCSNKDFVDND